MPSWHIYVCVLILLALKCRMTQLGAITKHAKFELFSWHYKVAATSTSGALYQCESFYSMYTYLCSLLVDDGEPLNGIMMAPSSLTKVTIHICVHGCMQTILWGCTFSSAPHTSINFTSIFLDRTSCLDCHFTCVLHNNEQQELPTPESQSYMRKSIKRKEHRHWFSPRCRHLCCLCCELMSDHLFPSPLQSQFHSPSCTWGHTHPET